MPNETDEPLTPLVVDAANDSIDEVEVSLSESAKEKLTNLKNEDVTQEADRTAPVAEVEVRSTAPSETLKDFLNDQSIDTSKKSSKNNRFVTSTPKSSKPKPRVIKPIPKDQKPKYFLPKKEQPDEMAGESIANRPHDSIVNITPDTMMIDWSDSDDESEHDISKNSDRKSSIKINPPIKPKTPLIPKTPLKPKPPPPDPDPDGSFDKKSNRKFKPKLYDFVLEDYEGIRDILIANERKFDDNFIIRCPHFAILLDHAIAVIWYFYRDWKNWNIFNVPQLEWAIKFLGGLVSHTTFPHVEIIKKQLQELLFIIYTEVPRQSVAIPEPELPITNQQEPELPVSLKAMLNRAPEFHKYLSTSSINSDNTENDTAQLDTYSTARIELMKNELAKLNAYEKRYEVSPNRDAELTEIIDKIKIHADEIVRVREQLDNRS